MKHLILFVPLVLLLSSSCEKKQSTNEPYNNNSFRINGVMNMNLPANGCDTNNISIEHLSGKINKVSLSIEGLPDKASYFISSNDTSPDFHSSIIISAAYAQKGEYTVHLNGVAENGYTVNAPFQIVIGNPIPCSEVLAAKFGVNHWGHDDIIILNIPGFNFPAVVDCEKGKLTIPLHHGQYTPTHTIKLQGSGTITDDEIRYVLDTESNNKGYISTYQTTHIIPRKK